MAGFDLLHMDDFERPFPKWALARKSLNISSFGMNVVELPPGETIPEHDEVERDHEEVFITLVRLADDGDRRRRTTRRRAAPSAGSTPSRSGPCGTTATTSATMLIVSAPRTSGYEPMGWA